MKFDIKMSISSTDLTGKALLKFTKNYEINLATEILVKEVSEKLSETRLNESTSKVYKFIVMAV